MTRRARVVIAVTALMLLSSDSRVRRRVGRTERAPRWGWGIRLARTSGCRFERRAEGSYSPDLRGASPTAPGARPADPCGAPAARRQAVQRGPAIDGRPGVDQPAPRSDGPGATGDRARDPQRPHTRAA